MQCWNTIHPRIRKWYQLEGDDWLESYLWVVIIPSCEQTDLWQQMWWLAMADKYFLRHSLSMFLGEICQYFRTRSVNIFSPDHGKNAARSCANSMKWERQQFIKWSFDLITYSCTILPPHLTKAQCCNSVVSQGCFRVYFSNLVNSDPIRGVSLVLELLMVWWSVAAV